MLPRLDQKISEVAEAAEKKVGDFTNHGIMGQNAPPGVMVPFASAMPENMASLATKLGDDPVVVNPHDQENYKWPAHLEGVGIEDPRKDGDIKLPGDGIPGFTYANHLIKRGLRKAKQMGAKEKLEQAAKLAKAGLNIYTDQAEALKTAVSLLGLYSDKNPGGMPIPVDKMKTFWFNGDEIEGTAEAEWRSLVEMGDRNMDPKRIRRFVNYDGSQTFEILNLDKTVMSRFTMGEARGQFLFTQGGYNKFAQLLERFKKEMGPDMMEGFEAMRSQFGG